MKRKFLLGGQPGGEGEKRLMEARPMTVRQFADYYGLCPDTVYRWISARKLSCFRTPGGDIRIRPCDRQEFEERNSQKYLEPVEPAPQPLPDIRSHIKSRNLFEAGRRINYNRK